jgi:hypothetical protein
MEVLADYGPQAAEEKGKERERERKREREKEREKESYGGIRRARSYFPGKMTHY